MSSSTATRSMRKPSRLCRRICLLILGVIALLNVSESPVSADLPDMSVVRTVRRGLAVQDLSQAIFLLRIGDEGTTRLLRADALLYVGTWSPSHDQIAFVQIALGGLGDCTVKTANVVTHEVSTLLGLPPGGCLFSPAWSPDGASILMHDELNVFRLQIDSLTLTQITSFNVARALIEGVTWAPGGRRFAFSRQGREGVGRLWVADADGSHAHVIHRCASRDCRAGLRTENPRWSPNGGWIAFSEDHNITIIRPWGGPTRIVGRCETQSSERPCSATSPTWSPDGSRLAYLANGNVVSVRLESGWSRTTPPGARPVSVSWS